MAADTTEIRFREIELRMAAVEFQIRELRSEIRTDISDLRKDIRQVLFFVGGTWVTVLVGILAFLKH